MTHRETILANTNAWLAELDTFLRIPSISTDSAHAADVQKAAAWFADKLKTLGAENLTIHQTPGHPIVTADLGRDTAKPTIFVYGHFDVQPPGDEKLWTTPAFEPTIRDGKLYARGATDDKGQVFCYLKAVELLQAQGPLPCNIRFLIEGSEEIGSVNLPEFLKAHPEILACDAAILSDTSIIDEDTPSITAGTRGHVGVTVVVHGPAHELHSGVFGGAVANPIEALAKMIAGVTDETGRIAIPGFYDDVRAYDDADRARIGQRGSIDATVLRETRVPALVGEPGFTSLERVGIRPAFTVLSVHGGPEFSVRKGVISPQAQARLALRIVPDQDPMKAGQALADHLKAHIPPGVTAKVEVADASAPWAVHSFDNPAWRAASAAYEKTFGKIPLPDYSGGTLPIAALFKDAGLPLIMMGFGLESDALHSPNEHISINRIQKGIETLAAFFELFPEEQRKERA